MFFVLDNTSPPPPRTCVHTHTQQHSNMFPTCPTQILSEHLQSFLSLVILCLTGIFPSRNVPFVHLIDWLTTPSVLLFTHLSGQSWYSLFCATTPGLIAIILHIKIVSLLLTLVVPRGQELLGLSVSTGYWLNIE